jgi:TorA maturation chaperone TorD
MVMDKENRQHDILKGYNMLLYFAGTMLMYEPSEECITDFWTKGILKNLPVSSTNPNFILAASQLRNSCTNKATCGKMLREDYIRLFARAELPLAPAYESLYRRTDYSDSDHQYADVTEFYNSYGWESRFKAKINDDHLSIELLFLTRLIDKYLILDDDVCRVEMEHEIRRFIDNHILSWIPEWNKKIQIYSNTLCFKGIGTLILACTEDIFSLLNNNTTTFFSTDNFKN